MKRVDNLYDDMYDINNLREVFELVCKKTKNKSKVNKFRGNKISIISKAYNDLSKCIYKPYGYKEFYIYEPKKRLIINSGMYDKYINHLVSEIILKRSIISPLIDSNVASQKGKGVSYGLELYYRYMEYYKRKYKSYYILKIDIKSFFASIDHEILKVKLKRRIKDRKALSILDTIIDSYPNGLPIGLYTSQLLSIFYLNDFDHYVKEELKIKHYIRYQDDMIIFHYDKEYLEDILLNIKEKFKELKLEVNKKTKIYKSNENINFLGRKRNKKKTNYYLTLRKLKVRYKEYYDDKRSLPSLISCISSLESNKYFRRHI